MEKNLNSRLDRLEEQYDEICIDMKEMQRENAEMNKMIHSMHVSMCGNELTKEPGFVEDIREMKKVLVVFNMSKTVGRALIVMVLGAVAFFSDIKGFFVK